MKVVALIYHLKMKFPTVEGIGQVRGSQYNSRECYNKSLELAEKEGKLPQMKEVGRVSVGLMNTNIEPRLQEEKSTKGPIEELIES